MGTIRSQLVVDDGIGNIEQRLPPCVAWRLVPSFADFDSHIARRAGRYPLRVSAVNPDGTSGDKYDVVDGGWQMRPMGPGWRIAASPLGDLADAYPLYWVLFYSDDPNLGILPGVPRPPASVLLFDASSAGGAQIGTPTLDLRELEAVEVFVDHASGLPTVLRDLVMNVLADGLPGTGPASVTLDGLLLRRMAGGALLNGADYAPGRARVYIGPNPPGGPVGSHVLYDVTSPANTALDTGPLDVQDMDSLAIEEAPSAAAPAGVIGFYDPDLSVNALHSVPTSADANQNVAQWGLPSPMAVAGRYAGGLPVPPPRRVRFTLTALGAAVTGRLRVIGRGRIPGTSALQMALPPFASFSLLPGGAAPASLRVVGRYRG